MPRPSSWPNDTHGTAKPSRSCLPSGWTFAARVEGEWRTDGGERSVRVARRRAGRLPASGFSSMIRPSGCGSGTSGGHAVRGDAEAARDLDGRGSRRVARGRANAQHEVFVPAWTATLVDAWFRLSFGC